MTVVEQMAELVARANAESLSPAGRLQLKVRILIGGWRSAPDRAALLNGALVRYLDFNDSYLAVGETCHPSDNLGAVLANADGRAQW